MRHAFFLVFFLVFSWGLAPITLADEDRLDDQVLVKLTRPLAQAVDPYDDRVASTGSHDLDAMLRDMGVTQMERVFRRPPRGWANEGLAQQAGLDQWIVVRFESPLSRVELVLDTLQAHEAIELCEPEQRGQTADTTPNDPDFGAQYSLQNGIMNAPQAWDIQTDSDTVVAVIDTGADLDHQDLVDNLWSNPGEIPGNGVDDDANGYIDDVVGWDFWYDDNTPEDRFGHGIHCSGIVGASTNNNRQVAGVCWNVKIMQIQAFSNSGGGTLAIAAASIVYAADNGAGVLSNSWGFTSGSFALQGAVSYATNLDAVVVAAAHNFGSDNEVYPAAYSNVMGIIATNSNDQKPSWSNFGDWCDMAAPGENVLNLYLGNGTASLSGTSMSTPHVAGAAALVRAVNPSLDNEGVRWTLNYSAVDLGDPGFDETFGWGRLDLFAAVKMARSLSISQNTASPGDTVTLELNQPDEPGFTHILLASMRGRSPGLSLNDYASGDYRQIAINYDEVLFPLILSWPSTGAGVFVNFFDSFDDQGQATATFNIPNIPYFTDRTVDMVYLTFDPNQPPGPISSTSCNVRLRIQ